jgi:hypothetical protein
MRFLVLLLVWCLAACDSPAPQMMGGTETKVTRDGHSYAVWQKGNSVEVIRFGYARRAELPKIRQTMLVLIAEVTGCIPTQRSLQGDAGEMRARLRCPRKGAHPVIGTAADPFGDITGS